MFHTFIPLLARLRTCMSYKLDIAKLRARPIQQVRGLTPQNEGEELQRIAPHNLLQAAAIHRADQPLRREGAAQTE